jgi:hypothetical protein
VFTGSLLHTGHTNNEHYFMGCGGGGGTWQNTPNKNNKKNYDSHFLPT